MANHASAVKAHQQSLVRRDRNRQYRTRLRKALKTLRAALDEGTTEETKQSFSATVSLIDKMVGKGVIHKNAGSRYKSRLTKRLLQASASA
ncbi:MAG: 30S ribosomal protein S20 [Vicinamibacterales bacterium]